MNKQHFKNISGGIFSGEINRRILIGILLFSAVVTLVLTFYKLYQDYEHEKHTIQIEIDSLKTYVLPILSRDLWLFDDEAIETLLDGIGQLPNVKYLNVVDENGRVLFDSGVREELDKAAASEPLVYFNEARSTEINLGTLSIFADYTHLYDELIHRFFVTLYTQLLETFVSSFFILILVHRLVSRHLVNISSQLGVAKRPVQLSDFGRQSDIQLDRTAGDDELETLVETINKYRSDIRTNLQTIQQAQLKMNEEVMLRQETKKDLDFKNTLIASLFDSIDRFVIVVDNDMKILMKNQTLKEALLEAHGTADIVGRKAESVVKIRINEDNTELQNGLNFLVSSQDHNVHTGYCQILGGASFASKIFCYPLELDGIKQASAILIEDVTDAHVQQQISYNATHDYLTGLYNRYQFDQEVQQIFSEAEPGSAVGEWSIGVLDIDIFSSINNLFGHLTGDEVLIELSRYLRQVFTGNSVIARLGGDEFVFALNRDMDQAYEQTLKLLEYLDSHPFKFNGEKFSVSVSIGLAKLDLGRDTLSNCLSAADRGCMRAKNLGGSRVECVVEPSSPLEIEMKHTDFRLIKSVRSSMEQNGLVLYSQKMLPFDGAGDLQIREEILVRQNKSGRMVSGGEFIPAFERARIAHLVDAHVFQLVMKHIRNGQIFASHINVNISPQSIYHRSISKLILELTELCIAKDLGITFEITENAIIQDIKNTRIVLGEIRAAGAQVAIDDFGIGHASYGYLDDLQIDMIKIDGSLIRPIEAQGKIHSVVSSIQSMASSFGALTVAEHTETYAQWEILRDIGIHYSQGYLHDVPSRIAV